MPRARLAGTAGIALVLTLSACSMDRHGEAGHHGDGDGSVAHGHGDAGGDHRERAADGGDHHGVGGEGRHEGLAGRAGDASEVDRSVVVSMSDAMHYTPPSVTVGRGETVRFEVTNDGELVHEFVLGTDDEILEHYETMKRFPAMEHEEPNSVSLEAGASGDVLWQFTEAGEITFACLRPGHYEAGMKGEVIVSATP